MVKITIRHKCELCGGEYDEKDRALACESTCRNNQDCKHDSLIYQYDYAGNIDKTCDVCGEILETFHIESADAEVLARLFND